MATPSYQEQMNQMRISQLELENKMLKEQLKAYELKFGPLTAPTAPSGRLPFTSLNFPEFLVDQEMDTSDGVPPPYGDPALATKREQILAEKKAASEKFLSMMSNFKTRLMQTVTEDEENTPTEESFNMPSQVTTQESSINLESPVDSPINTQ